MGSGLGAGFKRQGYSFSLAMRWMTGGASEPKLHPTSSTQPGSSADVEDVTWAGQVIGPGGSSQSASGRLQ